MKVGIVGCGDIAGVHVPFILSNSRLRQKARKVGVGAREFLRFASL